MTVRRRRPASDPYAPRRIEPDERPTAPEAMERRRGRATFTPPTEYFRQPVDVDWDRSRTPFPMRRPPQLQELGDPEILHTSKGEVAAAEAVRQARDAADEAHAGRCDRAQRLLYSAYGHMGAAVAHSGSGGRGITIGPVSSTVERARDFVGSRCKVTPRKGR